MKRAGYLATDGSSQDDVAGFAVVLAAVDGFKAFGFSDCNEDQTSYRAESAALRTVAHAARLLASKKVQGTLYVLCDCQAALQALENRRRCHCLLKTLAETWLLQNVLA